ncbi:hypothetical protein QAD02_001130 [Eretmocerus hayati]|uniref:Uncharacterized protein n=1 Tax=Eretmocerus hayati TaxID=131215 RepID=A0ACC2NG46_9HYME|nr:hypothetical protein QAD02_001130 [Eretmocerus hayati]
MKAVILIGGPSKGTRFRPLSLDIPKPLFPIAGVPIIQHHVEACNKLQCVTEVLIIGSYEASDIQPFADEMSRENNIAIRYLQEGKKPLGTAGALYHFRDQIKAGGEESFLILNGDVCADFPLKQLLQFHKNKKAHLTIMATDATREQSLNYGCLVLDHENCVTHYVEKPSTFVSTIISCGVYVASNEIFETMADVLYAEESYEKPLPANGNGKDSAYISLEQDITTRLKNNNKLFALPVSNWWSQVKTAGSAIYVNGHYLSLYKLHKPERLAASPPHECEIIGDVFIHDSATVHPSAVLGPNVAIGAGVNVGAGVRIRESIILDGAVIQGHSVILYSVVGKKTRIGEWARVEGTPCDPNPDKPFAKMESQPLFNKDGQLNPSATVLGTNVTLASERMLLNSIILPHKELTRDFKNEIVL